MEPTNPHPDEDAADALARMYALILSWPTTADKEARERNQQGDNDR